MKNKNINRFTVPRRAAWYILKTLLIIMFVVAAALFVFLESMTASNIYILVTEGMELRANCILGKNDPQEMFQYFSEDFVEDDQALNDNVYDYYSITKFDYRLSVDGLRLLPWNTTATMTVTERIPMILGNPNIDAPTQAVPEWINAQYKVACTKRDNRWQITKITKVKEVDPEVAGATPNMSLTPITLPPATPKPTQVSSSSSTTTTKP